MGRKAEGGRGKTTLPSHPSAFRLPPSALARCSTLLITSGLASPCAILDQADGAVVLNDRSILGQRHLQKVGQVNAIDHVVGDDHDEPAEVLGQQSLHRRQDPPRDHVRSSPSQVRMDRGVRGEKAIGLGVGPGDLLPRGPSHGRRRLRSALPRSEASDRAAKRWLGPFAGRGAGGWCTPHPRAPRPAGGPPPRSSSPSADSGRSIRRPCNRGGCARVVVGRAVTEQIEPAGVRGRAGGQGRGGGHGVGGSQCGSGCRRRCAILGLLYHQPRGHAQRLDHAPRLRPAAPGDVERRAVGDARADDRQPQASR